MAQVRITVAVERAVHDALAEALERIAEVHGLRVNQINALWIETSDIGKRSWCLDRFDISTTSAAPHPSSC